MNLDKQQLLLLNCSLKSREDTLANWNQWKSEYSLETAKEYQTKRMLPAVYSAIAGIEENIDLLRKLEELSKRVFAKNQLILSELEAVIKKFNENKIPSIVLKGAALMLFDHHIAETRVMRDYDLLVPEDKIESALAILKDELGYVLYSKANHAYTLKNSQDLMIDLHHRLFDYSPIDESDIWDRAIDVVINTTNVKVLDLTDQLFHVCLHARSLVNISLYWVHDAVAICRIANDQIDWLQFMDVVCKRDMRNHVVKYLQILADNKFINIPDLVFERLAPRHYARIEKLEEWEYSYPVHHPLRVLLSRITPYLRIKADKRYAMPIVGYYRFLKDAFKINSGTALFIFLVYKSLKIPIRWVCKRGHLKTIR